MNNECEIEIFYSDLTAEAQRRVLDGYGIKTPEEANWDVYPLFTLYLDPDDPGC